MSRNGMKWLLGLLIGVALAMLSLGESKAEDVKFQWQQEGDVVPTFAILYLGTAPFDDTLTSEDNADAVNGDVHALVEPTPVPIDGVVIDGETYDGVHVLVMTTPAPLPPVKLYKTMRARVGVDGQPSPPSNSIEMIEHIPVPDAPLLLGHGASLSTLFSLRRRRKQTHNT